ncbi:MAG: winged helix-turn-helix domain-containing protein [Halobacteriaceae archaeon]
MGSEPGIVEQEISADAAFEVLGHETRISIIETLGRADDPLSFSALRERVGERDSGQFNYHLDKLRDTFVTRTEDEGYDLSYSGSQVFGAVLAGRFTKTADVDDVPVEGDCILCGGALTGNYQGRTFTVSCTDCEEPITTYPIPPGVFESYDLDAYAEVASEYLWTRHLLFDHGFCEMCAGPIDGGINPVDEGAAGMTVSVAWECQRCGVSMESVLPAALMNHPVIQTFARDHGHDLEAPIWEMGWLLGGDAEIVAEDPLRVETSVELGGERLELLVDEALTILESERVSLE